MVRQRKTTYKTTHKKSYRKRKHQGLSEAEKRERNDRYADIISRFNTGEYGEDYVHVDMEQFFRLVFERKGQLRLQEQGKEHYNDGHYNAIIKKISRGGRDSHLWWIVTDTLAGIEQYKDVKFAIVAPVTYIGKTRNLFARKLDKDGKEVIDHTELGNARYLFAIAIDLDYVYPKNLTFMHNEIRRGNMPDPSFIVTSGSGLHLYYCFEKPIMITKENMNLLNRLKHTLTRMIWRYNGTTQQRNAEVHDINQGYRFPGTQTKTGRIVSGYTRHEQPLYHTPSSLNAYIKAMYKVRPELFKDDRPISDASCVYLEGNRKLTVAETRELEKDRRLPAHWSIDTARELFGEEWYQKMLKEGSIDWQNYSEALYTSWLNRLQRGVEVSVGHRYWCLWILAAWAWNCRIPYARLQRDAYDLMDRFNEIPNDSGERVPFTIRDCNAALSIYREQKEKTQNGKWRPIRLSRMKTSRITAIYIEPAKRNYRSIADHADYMRRSYRFLHDERFGGDGEETRGRKDVKNLVLQWRDEHPGVENKSLCARELGIDPKTVRRWWNGGVEQQEPHGLGAAANAGYITDKRIAGHAMAQVPGEHGEEETRETRYDLADTINDSEISVENIMKLLGFPENLIPIMKPQIEAAMSSPEFWEQYRKANPTVAWPPELEAAYQRVIKAHKDKSSS